MADGDNPFAGGSYSQLLFADDDNIVTFSNFDGLYGSSNSSVSTQKPPKMLCFGGDYQQRQKNRECDFGYPPQRTTQKSGLTCSDSSSTSSINNARVKKRNGYVDEAAAAQSFSTGTGAPAGSRRNSGKKIKSENSTAGNGHAKVKVRKEKLGERVSALQQLVSPFDKTDTASVLHEAAGYIKFLHDQVQVLCSPYLQRLHSSNQAQLPEGGGTGVSGFGREGVGTGENDSRNDLRSRGLCLVPVDCTMHMASNNSADFWSQAAIGAKKSLARG